VDFESKEREKGGGGGLLLGCFLMRGVGINERNYKNNITGSSESELVSKLFLRRKSCEVSFLNLGNGLGRKL
jgi:hypothetical protein